MRIKFSLFVLIFIMVSCNSTKPVVRTSTKTKQATNSKTVSKNNVTNKTIKPSTTETKTKEISHPIPKPNADSEVSLVATSNVKTYTEEVNAYIEAHKVFAEQSMRTYGIPASITLAQGILESGAGKGKLALSANNHFGIKCHKEWTGESVKHDDDSEQECFRKYDHSGESYRDHSLFLTSRPRYASLFKLGKGDYVAWAKGLKAAGYATDVKYPDKLIGLIERFELYKYDKEVLGSSYTSNSKVDNNTPEENYYTIQQGDTLYSISKRFNVSVTDLKKINKMSDNSISIGQQIKIK